MPDFDPAYESFRDETVEIVQLDAGVDDVSLSPYAAIDQSFTNWGGILWGAPAKWRAASLRTVAWMRPPAGVTDDQYDTPSGFASDNDPGPRFRGALDLAPGRYTVAFHARFVMFTNSRSGETTGVWGARSELNAPGSRWEAHVHPHVNEQPITLPPEDPSTWWSFEQDVTAEFDTRTAGVMTLFNGIAILGPASWGGIGHWSQDCTLTITRLSDFVPQPPEGLVAGKIRRGTVEGRSRVGGNGPSVYVPPSGPIDGGTF